MDCGRQALRPRLLVVVALAAAVHAYDIYAGAPLGSGIKLALFAGFLSYKARRAPAPHPSSNPPPPNPWPFWRLAWCDPVGCSELRAFAAFSVLTSPKRCQATACPHGLSCLMERRPCWFLQPKDPLHAHPAAATPHGWPSQAALLLTLWDDIRPRSSKDGARRPAPPQLAKLADPVLALAAEAGDPAAAEDPDDDGVVLTQDAQRAVDSILRREPRSVLKRLPRS